MTLFWHLNNMQLKKNLPYSLQFFVGKRMDKKISLRHFVKAAYQIFVQYQ